MFRSKSGVAVAIAACVGAFGCGRDAATADRADASKLPETPAEHRSGQEVYEAGCSSCHDSSRDGAPRLGYLAAWRRRLEKDESALVRNAVGGVGLMPPKGENSDLTEGQVAAAVGYMIYRAELDIPAGH